MSPEEYNIEIAKKLKILPLKCPRIGGCLHDLGYEECCCDTGTCDFQTYVPNYSGDSNLMLDVKRHLSTERLGDMINVLCEIVRRDHNLSDGPMTAISEAFRATPLQEAEAFFESHKE